MAKRSSYEILRKLLLRVRDGEATYAELERKLSTGYRTVKANCELLEALGQVKVRTVERHPLNGRESYTVSITQDGVESLRRMKEK